MLAHAARYGSYLIALVVLAVGVYFIWANYEKFAIIFDVDGWNFALLVLGGLIFIVAQGLVLKITAAHYDVYLGFKEWFGLTIVTFFCNYIFPFLGFGIRAAYLKRSHDLSYQKYGVLLLAALGVEFFIYASLAVLGLSWLALSGQPVDSIVAVFLGTLCVGFLVSLIWRQNWIPGQLPFSQTIRSLLGGWHEFIADRRRFLGLIAVTFIQFCGFFIMFHAAFTGLNLEVPLTYVAVVTALSDFSFVIRVTPVALGSFEAVVYYGLRPLEVELALAVAAAILVRVGLMIIFVPLGPWYLYKVFKGLSTLREDGPDMEAMENEGLEKQSISAGSNS